MLGIRSFALSALLGTALMAHARNALAQPEPAAEGGLTWRDEWPRFRWWEYALTGDVGVALAAHGSADVAGQMFLIDAQSLGLSAAISLGLEKAARRARPSTEVCDRDGEYEYYCTISTSRSCEVQHGRRADGAAQRYSSVVSPSRITTV